jgi:hypothetical protein
MQTSYGYKCSAKEVLSAALKKDNVLQVWIGLGGSSVAQFVRGGHAHAVAG